MSPKQAKSIFLHAVEQVAPSEWPRYLSEACGDDSSLRHGVELLLAAHQENVDLAEQVRQVRNDALPMLDRSYVENPGTQIGPYKLLQQIGEGGFGVVFMADQTEPVHRKVALKVIKPGMDTRQVIARFEAERQALAMMDHPNIAKILDAGTTGEPEVRGQKSEVERDAGDLRSLTSDLRPLFGRPYFVMELVKGVPITRYCDEQRLTLRQRLELFIPVCQAIQHAHQKGIIHRDIKPTNVLVALYDGVPLPKVIDFGVAKATAQKLTEKTAFTGFGQLIGTLDYMSPEQAQFNQLDIDTRSDVYSLGVLLYELFTGTTPFEQSRRGTVALDETLRIIREEEPPKPSTRLSTASMLPAIAANRNVEPAQLRREVTGDLDWIVMKALEKDRNRRYEAASSLASDIAHYLHDEPVHACPPSAVYRLKKFWQRNKGSLTVAAGVLLAVVVMAASIGWALRDRAARRAEAEQRETARLAKVGNQVRESLGLAGASIVENKLTSAREKLAQARAQLGSDDAALGNLAAEVSRGVAELNRFEQFLHLIDRAHEAETVPSAEPTLAADRSFGHEQAKPSGMFIGRRAAVPLLREALERYRVFEGGNWTGNLEGGLLGRQQVEQVRRLAYEELLWLADDIIRRKQEHGTEQTLSPEAAAQQALDYLNKAEIAHQPTKALYALRARCHTILKEDAAAQADSQRADETPATIAFDHFLRGQAAFDAKQAAEGIQAFEAALRLEPTHYWSLMWLGFCLCDIGKDSEEWDAAARVFTGCILHQPDHAHAYVCRAHAHVKLRRFQDAVDDYSRALELGETFVQAWFGRGYAYDELGQFENALADFSRVIEQKPLHARAWHNRGVVHQHLGQLERALNDVSRAIELDADYAASWKLRGVVHDALNQVDKALRDMTRAIELDAVDPVVWNNRGIVRRKLRQWEESVADHSRAIELDSMNALGWNARGDAYLGWRQLDKAIADYSRAIELDPGFAKAWDNRGIAHSRLRKWDQAIADFTKTIELNPRRAQVWSNRGWAYKLMDEPENAIVDFTRAIELDPTFTLAWLNRAEAQSGLRQWERAIADYSQIIQLNPKHANAWYGRGAAYGQLQQMDQAFADYSKVIELDAEHSRAWNNRGVIYNLRGQPEKAVADFSRAIELDPKLAGAWYGRGVAYRKLSQWQQAVADSAKAVELAPREARYWKNLGMAQHGAGDWKAAVSAFQEHLKRLQSGDAGSWFFLVMAYQKLGHTDEASKSYEQAVLWLERNQQALENDQAQAEELRRLQAEAQELMKQRKGNSEQEADKK